VKLRIKAAFEGGEDFSCVTMSFLLHFETTVGLLYIVVHCCTLLYIVERRGAVKE
jgi:hypothetical protein